MIARDPCSASELRDAATDARARTLGLVEDLSDEQMHVPLLEIVNPPLWEIGHVAWFQERWILRHCGGRAPIRADGDALYDSAAVHHDTRWGLPLPSRAETLGTMERVLEGVLEGLEAGEPDDAERYFHRLALYHEDMHVEALVYTRQTLGYGTPAGVEGRPVPGGGPLAGDAEIPGGPLRLGAERDQPFAFDNEQWAHEVEVPAFRLARAPVTQAEFAAFVEDGGYARRELWTEEGWRWRRQECAEHPVYWRRADGGWERRSYDRWVALEEHLPVHHVCAHEADAWCRWAGRRLPTEAEWERAAGPTRHPWGDADPTPKHAHLDLAGDGPVEVGAYPLGDTPHGLRQMTGNVWEWTASIFGPYPGFAPGPYKEYSEPWFGTRRVLRGGAFATRSRLIRNTWRNYFTPDRRDVLAGFRTASLDA